MELGTSVPTSRIRQRSSLAEKPFSPKQSRYRNKHFWTASQSGSSFARMSKALLLPLLRWTRGPDEGDKERSLVGRHDVFFLSICVSDSLSRDVTRLITPAAPRKRLLCRPLKKWRIFRPGLKRYVCAHYA